MKRILFRLFAVLAVLILAGFARAQQSPAAAPAVAPTQGAAATSSKTDYVLGAGDVIRIKVFQSPELSLDTRIPECGA